MSKNYEIDMCSGPIMSKLIAFAMPLMLSSILQLLFNAVDLVVVGHFSGSGSLAAVGATTALISLFINLFVGVSQGANVMTARYIASGDNEKVFHTVHTAITMAAISGLFMVAAGQIFAKPALRLMATPVDVLDKSALYMRIYFMGMPFFMLYNYGAQILNAIGDTKRPLYFLSIAGIMNVILNIALVTLVKLDVAGVAIATVLSQFISCMLVMRCLLRSNGVYRLQLSKLHIQSTEILDILKVGVPAGVQRTVISFSNVMLQSSVNSFGSVAMAGYTAVNNIMGFLFVMVNSVSQTCMTFLSQNYGAGKADRMDRVVWDCLLLETVIPLCCGIAVNIFGPQLISVYTDRAEVVARGMEIVGITMIPYFICGYMDMFVGALRGMGYSTVPMILSIIGTVGVRILWIGLAFPLHRTLFFLFICYPGSWTATVLMQAACFWFVRKRVRQELIPMAAGAGA